MSNYKLNAFTLIEISFVMVLVSIIIVFVYKGLSMFTNRLHTQNVLRTEITDFYLLRSTLYKDLFSSQVLISEDEKILFDETYTLFYAVEDNKLVRNYSGNSYVFSPKVNELTMKGDSVFHLEIDWKSEENLIIDFPLRKDKAHKVNLFLESYGK